MVGFSWLLLSNNDVCICTDRHDMKNLLVLSTFFLFFVDMEKSYQPRLLLIQLLTLARVWQCWEIYLNPDVSQLQSSSTLLKSLHWVPISKHTILLAVFILQSLAGLSYRMPLGLCGHLVFLSTGTKMLKLLSEFICTAGFILKFWSYLKTCLLN